MTAACTNCGQNSPYELIQAPGGAMVCHALPCTCEDGG